ncbi:MAG: beta-galactosidase [Bacteroidales bacterium]|jgi:hypothetical protein|nr:beta-galactosidase [Bacteroidales bacterium]
MKTNKFNFLTLLLAVAALLLFSCKKDQPIVIEGPDDPDEPNTEVDVKLSDISGNRLTVLGWYGVPFAKRSVNHFKTMADCGFTHNLPGDFFDQYPGAWPETDATGIDFASVTNLLDMAQAGGIKSFVPFESLHPWHFVYQDTDQDGRVEDHSAEYPVSAAYIEALDNHSALAGYKVMDEPQESTWNSLYNTLYNWLRPRTNKTAYVNLLPSTAIIISGGNYRDDYVKKYADLDILHMTSFDCYPIYREGGVRKVHLRTLYETLEAFSSVSKETGKPFWAFALTLPHTADAGEYPPPTLNDLHLQVYSNLAYGAQGIQYFTYWEVASTPDGDQRVMGIPAIVDKDGNPTTTYNLVKSVNKEIEVLSPVFLNATVEWVRHACTAENLPHTSCTLFDKAILPSIITDINIEGTSDGVVISHLKKGEDRFLVIVNRDINRTEKIRVSGSDKLYRIQKDDVTEAKILSNDNDAVHTLSPGDALIYFWKNE